MQVLEVRSKEDARQFLDVPKKIYRNDPFWVCPLDNEIASIFDPSDNILFKNGEAARWILIDERGTLIGRVAAFINRNKAFTGEVHAGGMGFFECIDNKDAAFLLFDTCKNWLAAKGVEAMDGPIAVTDSKYRSA